MGSSSKRVYTRARIAAWTLGIALLAAASAAIAATGPGTLDPTFGGRGGDKPGLSTLGMSGGGLEVQATTTDGQGRILVAGDRPGGGPNQAFFVGRFKPNGRPDKSFGQAGNGIVSAQVLSSGVDIRAVKVVSGQIFLAGGVHPTASPNSNKFFVAEFGSTGNEITSQTYDFASSSSEEAFALARQPGDGKLVLGGQADVAGNEQWALLRIDGTTLAQDNSFDGDGRLLTDWNPSTNFGTPQELVTDLLVEGSRLIAIGSVANSDDRSSEIGVAGYELGNGSLDPSFGFDGRRAFSLPGMSDLFPAGAVTTSPKKFVIAIDGLSETATGGGAPEIGLVRFVAARGHLDPGFGDRGFTILKAPKGADTALPAGLAKAPHGKLVVGGELGDGPVVKLMAARFLKGGKADKGFGHHGIASARIPNRSALGEGIAPTGKRVVSVGFADLNGPSDAIVALAGFRG